MENKILILDIETTGFSHRNDCIVEIGAVELDLNNGKIKTVFDSVVSEDAFSDHEHGGAWIFKNSDLTINDVCMAPSFIYELVAERFQKVVYQYPLGATAFNNAFDFGFLEDRGIEFPVKLGCPMLISTDICKIPGMHGGHNKWPSVEEAFSFFFPDENYVEKHRGADDAFHEAMIVYKLFQMGKFQV